MTYRAVVGLSYPAPSAIETVRRAGGLSQLDKAAVAALAMRRVKPGEICEDLPSESVSWLTEQGLIVLAEDAGIAQERRSLAGPRKPMSHQSIDAPANSHVAGMGIVDEAEG